METRHSIKGSFGSLFRVIIHYCIIMAAWSHKALKVCEKFLYFFGKTTPYDTIFKIVFVKFSLRHRSLCLCSNFEKFGRWEIGEIVRNLPDQKKKQNFAFLSVSNCCYCSDCAEKSTMYSECSRFDPNWLTFGRVIAERMNTAESPRKVNPIFGRSLSSSRIIIFDSFAGSCSI